MKTKISKTTTMMIAAAFLIGTVGIGAQQAFADTIDFEAGFTDGDSVGTIVTATNSVDFGVGPITGPTGNGIIAQAGAPSTAYVPNDAIPAAASGGEFFLTDGFGNSEEYFIDFSVPVANLSVDLYDYRGDGGSAVGDTATLDVFDDMGNNVGTTSLIIQAGEPDPSVKTLSIPAPTGIIKSAILSTSANDIGTGIDNIVFDTLIEFEEQCSEGDEICKDATANDANNNGYIEVGELVFFMQEITVTNPDDGIDWQDTLVTDNFGAEIQEIICDAGVIGTKNGNSEKHFLTWDIGALANNSAVSNSCDSQTGIDGDGEQLYTECGIHEYNSGAVVKAQVPKDNGKGTKQISYSTDSILVEVFTVDKAGDCDGDGLTDDVDPEPFVFNDEDGDGVGDGNDICPFDVNQGLGFDANGCAIPNP